MLHVGLCVATQAAAERLDAVQAEIASVKEQLGPLEARYEEEKGRVSELKNLQMKVEEVKRKIAVAERERDLARVADLR